MLLFEHLQMTDRNKLDRIIPNNLFYLFV